VTDLFRWLAGAYLVALQIGLVCGIVWTIAGLLYFHQHDLFVWLVTMAGQVVDFFFVFLFHP
jgi:hypothetical protein